MNGDLVTHPQRGDVHPSGPAVVTNHQEDCGDPTEHADGERCHPAHLEAASESEPREAGGWGLEGGGGGREATPAPRIPNSALGSAGPAIACAAWATNSPAKVASASPARLRATTDNPSSVPIPDRCVTMEGCGALG